MVTFKVVAVLDNDFERVVYVASERQVHQQDSAMKERVSFTAGGVGLLLDPKDYPEGTRFLLIREDR